MKYFYLSLLASALLLFSSIRYYQITRDTGLVIEHPLLHLLWLKNQRPAAHADPASGVA